MLLPTLSFLVFFQIDPRQQKKLVQDGFEDLIQENDFVVVEGTGHSGESKIAWYK